MPTSSADFDTPVQRAQFDQGPSHLRPVIGPQDGAS